MTPPRCSHPCAPRSASSVYCLPTPCFGAPCTVNRFNRHCFFRGSNNAVHDPLQPGFCREQHHLSAHSSCPAQSSCPAPWRCRQQVFHRTANMPKKVRTETKSGPTEHHQQRGFCKKTGRDMSEGGVTTGKKHSTATKTCWRRKMALTAAQTIAGSSLSPKNRHFLPT